MLESRVAEEQLVSARDIPTARIDSSMVSSAKLCPLEKEMTIIR